MGPFLHGEIHLHHETGIDSQISHKKRKIGKPQKLRFSVVRQFIQAKSGRQIPQDPTGPRLSATIHSSPNRQAKTPIPTTIRIETPQKFQVNIRRRKPPFRQRSESKRRKSFKPISAGEIPHSGNVQIRNAAKIPCQYRQVELSHLSLLMICISAIIGDVVLKESSLKRALSMV